ncbi:MAG TPA: hypothetical protein VH253_06020 [Phycisphaerae bacterium]|nr:hypothetical protein [Phycisphaerae bacterium]
MRRSRASALILILAVLALLTVLAAVYLTAAQLERRSTLATDESINLDFARDAFFAMLQDRLYDDTLGGYTGELMYAPRPWMPSDPDSKGPSIYQKFVPIDLSLQTGLARRAVFEHEIVMGPDFKLYYCRNSNVADFVTHGPPPGNTIDWAPLTADFVAAIGTPAARWYDYPERPLDDRWAAFGASSDAANHLAGTPDQPYLAKHVVYPKIGSTDLSFLTAARYNPATGMFDLAYNRSPSFVPSTGDTTVNDYLDANWNLLPFTSAAGTHYRFAFRLIDTNGRANLNTGALGSSYATMDADGRCVTAVRLDDPAIFDGDSPMTLHVTRKGFIPDRESYNLFEWQAHVGSGPSDNNPYLPYTFDLSQLFDIPDELELRAYEGRGTRQLIRPQLAWPHTLAPNEINHQTRNNYTAYSYTREVVPGFKGRFQILDCPPWQVYPELIPIDNYGGGRPINLTSPSHGFIEFANALSHVGYTDHEAISFALNYLYQETGDPGWEVIHDAPNYYLQDGRGPSSPSNGLIFYTPECQIPWPKNPPAVSADPPAELYLPYVAQPFLNEVAIILQPPQSQDDPPTALDFAVELLNPYERPLNLSGWRLRVGNDAWLTFGSEDAPAEIPAATDAEHPGFLTINLSRDSAGFRSLDAHLHTIRNKAIDPIGQPVFLERPYYDTHAQTHYLPIDQFPWPSPPPTLVPGGPTVTLSFQRNNLTKVATPTQPRVGAVDAWLAACPTYTATLPLPSLDAPNNVPVGDARLYGPYLPDRNADTFNIVAPTQYAPFCSRNIGQIEYVSRLGPRLTLAGPVTVPDLLADPNSLFTPGGRSYFPQEAKVRFDFLADPRALELLRFLSTYDINRIPGRVNVNTASAGVIHAVITNITSDDQLAANLTAAIVAYRDRTTRALIDDKNFRYNGPNYDFSNSDLYPGRGIRSIAELEIPIGLITGVLRIDRSVNPPQIAPAPGQTLLTLHGTPYVRYRDYYAMNSVPDAFFIPPPNTPIYELPPGVPLTHPGALWPRLFTQLTVRSDTFVVEGVLEALRVHPNVSADPQRKIHHDNAHNWYDFDEGGNSMPGDKATVDDPTLTLKDDSYLRNLRIAHRRFIGIIDRSYANYQRGNPNFTLPRIVALEDLPQ